MPLGAGMLNRRVTFKRRATVPTALGGQRGGFEAVGATVWGRLEDGAPLRIAMGDFHGTVPTGTLTVRDDAASRAVTPAFQVAVDGAPYEVRAVLRQPRGGEIVMHLVGSNGRDVYAQEFDQNGEVVVMRRVVPNGSPIQANARARVMDYSAAELAMGVQQGARRVLISAADLEAAGWPLPPRVNDKVLVRGATLNVQSVDDSTHRVAGVLLAYELSAMG